jgi:hypothetical protein
MQSQPQILFIQQTKVASPITIAKEVMSAPPVPKFTTPTKNQKSVPTHKDILKSNIESFDDDVAAQTTTQVKKISTTTTTVPLPQSSFSTPQAKKTTVEQKNKISMTTTKSTPNSVRFSLQHNRTQEFDFRLPVEVKDSLSTLLQRPTPKPVLKRHSFMP